MIIEMRVYRCAPGRLAALPERFAKHTLGLFGKQWRDMAEREAEKPIVASIENQFFAPAAFFPQRLGAPRA